VSDYKFSSDYIYFSCLSRLAPEKGVKYLLGAFAKLRKDMRAKLIIIGEGQCRKELEAMTASLAIQNDVNFLGYRDNPFKYLAKSDIFVLPSLYEGLPNVILESQACGVPVIATRCVGGIQELICDGKNGMLADPADELSLYTAMHKMAGDKQLRNRFKEEATKGIAAFDLPVKLKEYENLFFQALTK